MAVLKIFYNHKLINKFHLKLFTKKNAPGGVFCRFFDDFLLKLNMRAFSKIAVIITIILVLLVVAGGFLYFSKNKGSQELSLQLPQQKNMKLTSSVFKNNGLIPPKYTCDGENVNPPLQISEVPEGTKSLALVIDDPDAPMETWDHWIIWNINPAISSIDENSVPPGATEGLNSAKQHSYSGPCPPSGTHHYHFKLYALDTTLNLDPASGKKELEKAIENHILDFAELIGLYQRK